MKRTLAGMVALAVIMPCIVGISQEQKHNEQMGQKDLEIQSLNQKITELEDLLYCDSEIITIEGQDANLSDVARDVLIYIDPNRFKTKNFRIYQDGQKLESHGGGLNGMYWIVPEVYSNKETILEVRYICECMGCDI